MDIYSVIFTGIFLGIGLSMDAFSISLASGLEEPNMKFKKQFIIAFAFGFFQYMMPMIGYIFVSVLSNVFSIIKKFLPYISFVLLSYIGIKLILEGIKYNGNDNELKKIEEEFSKTESSISKFISVLLFEAVVTSIDALSIGFTMGNYNFISANIQSIFIGITTFIICMIGIKLGKFFGFKFKKPALIFGGAVLIIIGLRILIIM